MLRQVILYIICSFEPGMTITFFSLSFIFGKKQTQKWCYLIGKLIYGIQGGTKSLKYQSWTSNTPHIQNVTKMQTSYIQTQCNRNEKYTGKWVQWSSQFQNEKYGITLFVGCSYQSLGNVVPLVVCSRTMLTKACRFTTS